MCRIKKGCEYTSSLQVGKWFSDILREWVVPSGFPSGSKTLIEILCAAEFRHIIVWCLDWVFDLYFVALIFHLCCQGLEMRTLYWIITEQDWFLINHVFFLTEGWETREMIQILSIICDRKKHISQFIIYQRYYENERWLCHQFVFLLIREKTNILIISVPHIING